MLAAPTLIFSCKHPGHHGNPHAFHANRDLCLVLGCICNQTLKRRKEYLSVEAQAPLSLFPTLPVLATIPEVLYIRLQNKSSTHSPRPSRPPDHPVLLHRFHICATDRCPTL